MHSPDVFFDSIHPTMNNRRQFIAQTALGALGITCAPAIEPIQRAGTSRMQLGLAAYSFRKYFRWMKDKEQKVEGRDPWSINDFVDWCADHNVPGAELTSYFFPPDVDEAFCLELRRQAYLRGVQICGTAVGNTFTDPEGEARDEQIAYVKKWTDFAAAMTAPHIRVFAGKQPKDISPEEAIQNCKTGYQECLDYAATKGVFLGLENHGGIVEKPEALLDIVRSAQSPWAGINFDSGNFRTDDPYADLEKIAPFAINVQLKMEMKPPGRDPEPADIERILGILRKANYQGWFVLEYEMEEDPFVAVPRVLEQLRPML